MPAIKTSSTLVPFIVPLLRSVFIITLGLLILTLKPFRGKDLAEVSAWWPLVCIVANLLTILLLYILMKRKGIRIKDLILHSPRKHRSLKEISIVAAMMVLFGIGGLVGISFLVYGYMPVTNSQPIPVWAAMITLLLLPGTIVLSEIPFYLGYSAPDLRDRTKRKWVSIVYPLFFYALQHSFFPLILDWRHMVSRFLMFIPLLIMMGIWYSRKKDLLPLMIGHGLLDIGTGIQLLLVSLNPSMFDMNV